MNSLQDLNFYSNTGVQFEDARQYTITFSGNANTVPLTTTVEGLNFSSNSAIEITSLVSTPRNIIFQVNLSSIANANVAWSSLLPNTVVTTTPSTGVFQANGINGLFAWNIAKGVEIVPPPDLVGNVSYTSSIIYPNTANITLSNTITWTTNVSIANLDEITIPNAASYSGYVSNVLTEYPIVIDADLTNTYNLVITPNNTSVVNSISTISTVGTGTFNAAIKTFTITGNKSQVNERLSSLVFTPYYATFAPIRLTYLLTNLPSNTVSNVGQTLTSANVIPGIANYGNISYDQDTTFNLIPIPIFGVEQENDVVNNYSMSITPSNANAVSLITTSNVSANTAFDGSTKQFTVTGSRSTINQVLSTTSITPANLYNQNFGLVLTVVNPPGPAVTQNVNINSQTITMSAPTLATFTPGNTITPLTGTPTITLKNYGTTRTTQNVTLLIKPNVSNAVTSISSIGNIGATSSYSGNTYTITGNINQVSGHLANITVVPLTSNSFTLTYSVTDGVRSAANVTQTVYSGNTTIQTINAGVTRYYTQYQIGLLFPNTAPTIIESVSPAPTYRVELTLNSNIGVIGTYTNLNNPVGWSYDNLRYTVEDTQGNVNAILQTLYFVPHSGMSGNAVVHFVQSRTAENTVGYTEQLAEDFNLIGSEYVGTLPGEQTYTITSSQTFTPTLAQSRYLRCDILMCAGGGAGGVGWAFSNPTAGGGGAGELVYIQDYSGFRNPAPAWDPSTQNYSNLYTFNIVVGTGGVNTWRRGSKTFDGFYTRYYTNIPIAGPGADSSITNLSTSAQLRARGGGYGGGLETGTVNAVILRDTYGNPSLTGTPTSYRPGGTGGSGGGGVYSTQFTGGLSTKYNQFGLGNYGGRPSSSGSGAIFGGGGAGSVGGANAAGLGFTSNITGTYVEYCRGGGARQAIPSPGYGPVLPVGSGSGGNAGSYDSNPYVFADIQLANPSTAYNVTWRGTNGNPGIVILKFYR